MATNIKPNDVMSGSFGRCYVDGREWAEIESFKGTLSLKAQEVKLSNGEIGKKNTGSSFEIKIKVQKVFSPEVEILKSVIAGRLNPTTTINVQIDDAEARGAEAFAYNDCTFTGDIDIGSYESQELIGREFTLSCLPSSIEALESVKDI